MFNQTNQELAFLCVMLLIEMTVPSDLTEMLHPYSHTYKVTLLYIFE